MKFAPVGIVILLTSAIGMAQDLTHIDSHTPRDLQVRIAKLAAPEEVSAHADVYVLGEHGYELAERGTNGFSCMIERERAETMEPECYDAEGTRTIVKVRIYVERQRARGLSDQEIDESVRAGYKTGKFKPPSKPGIVYMLSDHNYVLDPETGKVIRFPGHLMFYAPFATEKSVGSGEGAPYIVHPGQPDALIIVVPAKRH